MKERRAARSPPTQPVNRALFKHSAAQPLALADPFGPPCTGLIITARHQVSICLLHTRGTKYHSWEKVQQTLPIPDKILPASTHLMFSVSAFSFTLPASARRWGTSEPHPDPGYRPEQLQQDTGQRGGAKCLRCAPASGSGTSNPTWNENAACDHPGSKPSARHTCARSLARM